MREVMISQRTLAYSLAYMQWDPSMSLKNLKNTRHHIHIFINGASTSQTYDPSLTDFPFFV